MQGDTLDPALINAGVKPSAAVPANTLGSLTMGRMAVISHGSQVREVARRPHGVLSFKSATNFLME